MSPRKKRPHHAGKAAPREPPKRTTAPQTTPPVASDDDQLEPRRSIATSAEQQADVTRPNVEERAGSGGELSNERDAARPASAEGEGVVNERSDGGREIPDR